MICSHTQKTKLADYRRLALFKCRQCGLILSSKYKKGFDHRALYKNYYRNELAGRFKFGLEGIIKLFRFFRAFKIYTLSPQSKSILDIGSGRGFMLYFLKKYYGYQKAVGTQLDQNMLKFSREILNLEIFDKDLLKIPFKNSRFDIITIWHVLEHVKKPEQYLKKIHQLLSKKGKLIIEVPNYNSWSKALTNEYWLSLDPKHHLTFFNPRSLSKLLHKYHFKVETIHTFSLEYSTFTSVQSFVSLLTKSDQLFFNWLQTGNFKPSIFLHLFLFFLLTPACLLINLLLFFSKKGEVLLVVASKK